MSGYSRSVGCIGLGLWLVSIAVSGLLDPGDAAIQRACGYLGACGVMLMVQPAFRGGRR